MTDYLDNIQGAALSDIWLSALLSGIVELEPSHDRLVGALQLSSENVHGGDVFLALPGLTADGRDYIDNAVSNKAAAILFDTQGTDRETEIIHGVPVIAVDDLKSKLGDIASRYYNNPSNELNVVAVTGTNGKTTTAYLIAQALDLAGMKCGYVGTIGYGRVGQLKASNLTTLDAISIQKELSGFHQNAARAVSMEVSSHGLHQGRTNGIEFDIGVFTNLSQDHLDYHGSMERYALAKRKLFEYQSVKSAVINIDDKYGRELMDYCRDQSHLENCIGYGEAGDLIAKGVQIDDRGIEFQIDFKQERLQTNSKLLGAINLPNLMATIGALLASGISLAKIAQIIPELEPPPGRMEVFRGDSVSPMVVVDYAHTPDALNRALESLKPLCRGKLSVVFGCGGDRDQKKRPMMGEAAQRLADRVILTDDNPRTESPHQIIEQIKAGMTGTVKVIHDRQEALKQAISDSLPKDIILLAGKGHETTQTIGAEKIQLSDRKFVAEILESTQ